MYLMCLKCSRVSRVSGMFDLCTDFLKCLEPSDVRLSELSEISGCS